MGWKLLLASLILTSMCSVVVPQGYSYLDLDKVVQMLDDEGSMKQADGQQTSDDRWPPWSRDCSRYALNYREQCKDELEALEGAEGMTCSFNCMHLLWGWPTQCLEHDNRMEGGKIAKLTEACGMNFNDRMVGSSFVTTDSLANHFPCDEGDGYQWVELDPDEASQLGEARPGLGPENAISSNCTDLGESCCSVTAPDSFSWWQYNLGESMQVKGARITAPPGECCVDGDCQATRSCASLYFFNSTISVGNFSLPEFYLSSEYEEIASKFPARFETLAQPAVLARMLANSTMCSPVTETDFQDPVTGSMIPSAGLLCGQDADGSVWGSAPTGRHLTVSFPAAESKNLAICGIQICARTLKM